MKKMFFSLIEKHNQNNISLIYLDYQKISISGKDKSYSLGK